MPCPNGSDIPYPKNLLRWYDALGNWMLTPEEQEKQRAEMQQQRAEIGEQMAERLAQLLRAQGIDPDNI